MEPRIQYDKTSDGLSIAYCAAGEGAPLVVTPYHSTSHAWMEWQYEPIRLVYERLAWSFRLVRYDRRGTGLSERSSEMSPDSEQGDLEAVMGALGDVRAVLAGRGFAGLAAVRYAVRHPERLSHLVLYDTVASIDEWKSDAFMQAQFAMIKSLVKKDYEGLVRLLSQLGFSSHAEWFASFIRESGSS